MDQTTIVIFGESDEPRHVITLNVPEGRADAVADTLNETLSNMLRKVSTTVAAL